MRGSLIAAGGALLAAATLFGAAGPAAADIWTDWTHHYPEHCNLGVNEDSTYHHVTSQGVFAGTRDADACKKEHGWHHGWGYRDHHHHDHDRKHWEHRNWPTSGNGNWIGHGYGPGVGIGVGD
ncbi:hypothetical protein FAF44_30965 [Nonomuraea sp. MG754425]|uniref:hypothetical protein n=1 Tax=Nonomuraea sp. MG754425 TaxID=2570319 RepID=UPI001F32910F|nr:hypothetical protein [Nonomuraea sp. MG754425]MCF6472785.1 hypothetical protein [Nonomuraea sp. MG754425]